jgi:hypothetical protein
MLSARRGNPKADAPGGRIQADGPPGACDRADDVT